MLMAGEQRRRLLSQRYWRLVARLDPQARSPRDLFADRVLAMPDGALWLDAGCGRHSLPAWRRGELQRLRERSVQLVGCDLDREALRDRRDAVCLTDLERLPFRESAFDFVSSNMVFEHLRNPDAAARELTRVTRPGGRILVHTVNARHYLAVLARLTPLRFHQWVVGRVERRQPQDVYPTQYRANTERLLCALFRSQGCRPVWGGEIADLPLYLPYPGLFWIGLGVGLLERRLARLPGLGTFARSNLLLEFERVSE